VTDDNSWCEPSKEDLPHLPNHFHFSQLYPCKKLLKAQKPAKFQRTSFLVIILEHQKPPINASTIPRLTSGIGCSLIRQLADWVMQIAQRPIYCDFFYAIYFSSGIQPSVVE